MKPPVLALVAIVLGVVVSSCAVGVRQPATNITASSAVINGKVLSTTGGAGSWFIEYQPEQLGFPSKRTPTRNIDFVVNESHPVSEPVDGLLPGRTHSYKVCAEDSDNPGDPFCSRPQHFRTVGDSVAGFGSRPWVLDLEESYTYDVASGPSGENAYGYFRYQDGVGRAIFGGATCLAVGANRAVIGFEVFNPLQPSTTFHEYHVVVDGGPTGNDMIGRIATSGPATDCASVTGGASGGFTQSSIVVTDD
jgi:hypothetical protein